MRDIQKILHLKFLYYQKMFGGKYIENINLKPFEESLTMPKTSLYDMVSHCALCDRSKSSKPAFGILPSEPKIIFVTQLPLVNAFGAFLENKSSKMLQDIAQNVFALKSQEYGVLSLVKCDDSNLKVSDEEILICKQYLNEQILSKYTKIIILMGDCVLAHLLGLNFEDCAGSIFTQNGKAFLATYSLNQLLKNPSLKKEAMKHFLLARGYFEK
ncbi:uracil-DNA glycosylase family protein [Helicobacter sp. 12S02232-10]|uniref:uracil-DNA glycosylase family protein n=1 Tax=Helicobacter sp. 12S02232-10 TaxID=1476197 RepID=UPI000BA6D42A|nr:uracil-DNA glycosylase family protein [Helicobacter sp. 12S02232-10]